MEVEFSKGFRKQYEKSPKKIRLAFNKRVKLFLQNPLHPLLKNHRLTGSYSNFCSINITGDWRALYTEYFNKQGRKIILFEVLGTHNRLYK